MPESKQSISLLHNLLSERHWRLSVCTYAFECAPYSWYVGIFVNFLLKLYEVAGSLFCVLVALCFQFVLFCVLFFFFLFFLLFFQAVSPQLPHADSSDIHFSFYPPPPSSFPTYIHRSRVSIRFGTLTSLYSFSSFSFKAQNLTFPTLPSF